MGGDGGTALAEGEAMGPREVEEGRWHRPGSDQSQGLRGAPREAGSSEGSAQRPRAGRAGSGTSLTPKVASQMTRPSHRASVPTPTHWPALRTRWPVAPGQSREAHLALDRTTLALPSPLTTEPRGAVLPGDPQCGEGAAAPGGGLWAAVQSSLQVCAFF